MTLEHLLNKGEMVEHLSKVADHLDQHEWNRGSLSKGRLVDHNHCLLGAHYCQPVVTRITSMEFAFGMGFSSVQELTDWNDRQHSKEPVIDRIRRQALKMASST